MEPDRDESDGVNLKKIGLLLAAFLLLGLAVGAVDEYWGAREPPRDEAARESRAVPGFSEDWSAIEGEPTVGERFEARIREVDPVGDIYADTRERGGWIVVEVTDAWYMLACHEKERMALVPRAALLAAGGSGWTTIQLVDLAGSQVAFSRRDRAVEVKGCP